MLRKPRMSYDELCQVVAELPEEQRVSAADLDSALASLCEKSWLVRSEEAGVVIYAVNVRKKTGTQDLSGKARATQLLQKIENEPTNQTAPDTEESARSDTNSDQPRQTDEPPPRRPNPLDKLL
jgi:predicted transcriptional regulator